MNNGCGNADVLKEFKEWLLGCWPIKENSAESYCSYVRGAMDKLGKDYCRDLVKDEDAMRVTLKSIDELKIASGTRQNYKSALRALFYWNCGYEYPSDRELRGCDKNSYTGGAIAAKPSIPMMAQLNDLELKEYSEQSNLWRAILQVSVITMPIFAAILFNSGAQCGIWVKKFIAASFVFNLLGIIGLIVPLHIPYRKINEIRMAGEAFMEGSLSKSKFNPEPVTKFERFVIMITILLLMFALAFICLSAVVWAWQGR